jgi:hypothetical protein
MSNSPKRRPNSTYIPECILEAGLNVYQMSAYLQVKYLAGDSGICFESVKKMADDCCMSVDKMRKALNSLTEVNEFLGSPLLIKIPTKNEYGGDDTNAWIIVEQSSERS